MKTITLAKQTIVGLKIRTSNQVEMKASASPEGSNIGKLHQDFNQNVVINYQNGANLYGVYHHYESDQNGDYDILVGSTPNALTTDLPLEAITLAAGKYLVFSKEGEMPHVVMTLWDEVWSFFNQADVEHKRTFSTDFERYTSATHVDIYIAVE